MERVTWNQTFTQAPNSVFSQAIQIAIVGFTASLTSLERKRVLEPIFPGVHLVEITRFSSSANAILISQILEKFSDAGLSG